jgi:hypothetical protein
VTRAAAAPCAFLLIGQLNYSKCNSDYTLKTAPTHPAAELTPEEVKSHCVISSVWPDLHMIEIRCQDSPALNIQRYCIDGATIGSFRKKNELLVNCLIDPRKKQP